MLNWTSADERFWERFLTVLPDKIFDAHVHVWTKDMMILSNQKDATATWAHNFINANILPYEDLQEAYKLLFPDRQVKSLIFGMVENNIDVKKNNTYVGDKAAKYSIPGLAVSRPEWSAEELIHQVEDNGLIGIKPYPNFVFHIPTNGIRITDMVPRSHLEVANEKGWVLTLHLPRKGRLGDEANLEDLLMIEREFSHIRMIVAHIGRAYCAEDLGLSMDMLRGTKNMRFDFSGNTNSNVFRMALEAFGAERLMFGSDAPIAFMRMRRIHENGLYINEIPAGSCGDVAGDPHVHELPEEETKDFSLFVYEVAAAMLQAIHELKLSDGVLEKLFYKNAESLLCK